MGKNETQIPKIKELIDKYSVHIFAEVGVWKFKMLKKLMVDPSVTRMIKEYWAIDPYSEMPQYTNLTHEKTMYKMGQIKQERWDSLYYGVCKYLLWFHQVKLLRLSSKQAADLFHRYRKSYFDMVFIDADHTYEALKQDITLWKPLVRKGGVLCGHDYGTYPDVKEAVDECLPNATIFPQAYIWMVEI